MGTPEGGAGWGWCRSCGFCEGWESGNGRLVVELALGWLMGEGVWESVGSLNGMCGVFSSWFAIGRIS